MERPKNHPKYPILFEAKKGFPLYSYSEDDIRLYIIFAGEHFGTGALTAFLRQKPLSGNDICIIFLPPLGTNQATVGRFLAYLNGMNNFIDLAILLDSNAQPFLLATEKEIQEYTLALIEIMYAFERSGCMVPLLMRMNARTFSFSASPIKEVVSRGTLDALWEKCSVPIDPHVSPLIEASSFLAFSISKSREKIVSRLFQQTFPLHKILHLPFYPRYEWAHTSPPPTRAQNWDSPSYTGIFCADHFSPNTFVYLTSYKKKYFPTQNLIQEQPDADAVRWLTTHNYKKDLLPLTSDQLNSSVFLQRARTKIKKEFSQYENSRLRSG